MKKQIVDKYKLPKSDNYNPDKDRSFRVIFISIIGFFVGFGLCVGFYGSTLIDIFDLSKFIVGFAVIGFLIPLKFYTKWFHFIKYETIIFNIIGVAPLLTGLFLLLNFTFASDPFTHNYKIEKIYLEGEQDFRSIGVVLENNFFSGERKIVELTDLPPTNIFENKFLKVTISKGLFGFDVIKERILIK